MYRIKHIDHVVLRVVDVESMMRFYRDVIGCTLEKVQEDIGLYQLRAGSSLIDLVPVAGELGKKGGAAPGEDGLNLDHVCLSVEPFDGAAITEYLRGKGCDPGPVKSRYGADGHGPSLYVADPEGNVVELKGPPGDAKDK